MVRLVEHLPDPSPPTANAGPDLRAAPGEAVTLQGRHSTNPHGPWYRMAHRWHQLSGPPVTLRNPTWGNPSFTVPSDAAAGATLRFRLTVTDRDDETSSDTVTVTVSDAILPSVGIATVKQSVSAGSPGQFRVTVNPLSTTDLRVHLNLAATGSPGVATGASSVTIPAAEDGRGGNSLHRGRGRGDGCGRAAGPGGAAGGGGGGGRA